MSDQPVAEGAFVFIDETGQAMHWRPQSELGRIHAVARLLADALPAGAAVGLLFRSGVDLVANWFACLHAGLQPLIVQYPTRKQSRAYWYDSVTHTIATAGLVAIISDDHCAGLGLPDTLRILRGSDLLAPPLADPGPLLPASFSILQLSSGTTGYRKAMVFGAEALRCHAHDYNAVLRLQPGRDRIVSWLPLYHDMGYVACFVMPVLLGIDVVMMDPQSWVQTPALLFDAIEQHSGTVCYMPNFGFEVMTRAPGRALPSMRHWVSCSEPVSAAAAKKFCAHIGADPQHFAPCYAMAENLFAVTFGTGFNTATIDGAEVVSCGRPIPGVELKAVDGEIWVRSPTSLAHYLGGDDIRNAEGYYPTGDMGQIIDGALYVAGRKQDVLIQAGRKFMLSDVDLKLNEAFPEVRGRGATLALRDDRLGTETPLILIEAVDFFDRTDAADIAARMTDLTGMDQVEVAYVPPRFLTKTSSGKINRRKARDDWLAVQDAKHRTAGPRDAVQELRDAFPLVDWSRPIKDVLDSLSTTIIKITLETTSVLFDPSQSLSELAAALANAAPLVEDAPEEGIRIVSIADRSLVARLTEEELAQVSRAFGCKVTLEHVCLPPAPVLLSDLIFHDWFQPRLDQDAFSNVDEVMERIKHASVILVDEISQINFLPLSVYPVLSHRLERHERADLLCYRWQNYTKQHHRLPVSFVSGKDLPLGSVNEALRQISRYLKTPIFRVLSAPALNDYCSDWEYKMMPSAIKGTLRRERVLAALIKFLKSRDTVRLTTLPPGPALMVSDLAHFCSVMANRQAVNQVTDHFSSFYIGGQPASLAYLRQRLEDIGKPYVLLPSITPEFIDKIPEKCECLIVCGSWGVPPDDLPVISFQHICQGWRLKNLGPAQATLKEVMRLNDMPASADDWYLNVPIGDVTTEEREATMRSARTIRQGAWGSCPELWSRTGAAEQGWLPGQAASAGRLTVRSSLSGAMVSSVM